MQGETLYSFGPFALDASQRVLLRDGGPLRLTPREVDVLAVLVERHGEIVDKSFLLDRVWRGLCVEECNLSQHVAALRRVLGDDARVPSYIETVPRRGYRFVAPVVLAPRPPGPLRPPPPEPALAAGAEPPPAPLGAALTPAPLAPAPLDDALVVLEPTPPPLPLRPPPSGAAPPAPPAASRASRRLQLVGRAALFIAGGLGLVLGVLGARARSATPAIQSIAVLPFANLTGDSHQDHVAETLTAALRSDLRSVARLRVDAGAAPSDEHLVPGVDAFVESALLSAEGRLRIAAELFDARSGRLLWAEVIEADPVGFLEAEDRIVRAVVARAEDPLRAREEPDGDHAAARREYALARQYLSRRTPQVVEEAVEHFGAAVGLDPDYALAHAGLADAYLFGAEQRVLPPGPALSSAEAAARRALELDPGLAEAHGALGVIAAARWDFGAAEAAYRRALALDPSIGKVHERYAALLTVQDRHEEAIAEARVARDLDPSCPAAATGLAAAYYHARRPDAAIEQALAALRLTPRFAAAYDVLGWAHRAKGLDAEAIAAFGEAVRLSGRNPSHVAALARAYARTGAHKQARQLLHELERSTPGHASSPLDLAEVLSALGETDAALRQIERAVAEGVPWLPRVDSGLGLAALHEEARFRALGGRTQPAAGRAVPVPEVPSAAARRPVQACREPGPCRAVPNG